MTFIPHTPEALIPRSDSKNPATTCKGITSGGRPCRRALATNSNTSPQPSPSHDNGVLAVVSGADGGRTQATAFFCWQHKDQAENLVAEDKSTKVFEVKSRNSIDTLVDRLGVMDAKATPLKQTIAERRKAKRAAVGADPIPLEHISRNSGPSSSSQPKRSARPSHGKSNALLSLFCCVRPPSNKKAQTPHIRFRQNCGGTYTHDWDDTSSTLAPPLRARTKVSKDGRLEDVFNMNGYTKPASMSMEVPNTVHSSPGNPFSQRSARQHQSSTGSPHASRRPVSQRPSDRPSLTQDPPSQTTSLLALIPPYLNPQTTSLLLAELGKPVSAADEPGFIYMFWLTPASTATTTAQTSSSLLPAPSTPKNAKGSRASAIMSSLPSNVDRAASTNERNILLKIGRASNVQRRMNEWKRQCGYDLSLIRFYPYVSSSSRSSTPPSSRRSDSSNGALDADGAGVRKVPHAHKVERLIHIELADKRVKKLCETCGREHREWFEVEASREGVKAVDEVVRRWVAWGEGSR
ncbi:MAG: hypothetical protein M1812_002284 [Candelaria pacifica]|nr:MAG: hypothetical protein M1812_002284 [Candelaria pacifica]